MEVGAQRELAEFSVCGVGACEGRPRTDHTKIEGRVVDLERMSQQVVYVRGDCARSWGQRGRRHRQHGRQHGLGDPWLDAWQWSEAGGQ
jgi:hypothetical protein